MRSRTSRLILLSVLALMVTPASRGDVSVDAANESIRRAIEAIRDRQKSDGSWPIYGRYTGGATSLCRSDVLYERLKRECSDFVRDCEQHGLKYTNVMPERDDPASGMGRSWASTLGVTTREQAETRLKELNYSWEWLEDGCLRAMTPALPAVKELSPGRRVFFNQLIAAYCGWRDERNDPSTAIRQ